MKIQFLKWVSICLIFFSIIFFWYISFQYQKKEIIEKPLLMDFFDVNEKMKSTETILKNISSSKNYDAIYNNLYINYIYDLESISKFSDNKQYSKYNLDEFKKLLITLDCKNTAKFSRKIQDKLLIICSNWNQFKWDEIKTFSYDFKDDPLELRVLVKNTNRLSEECLLMIK